MRQASTWLGEFEKSWTMTKRVLAQMLGVTSSPQLLYIHFLQLGFNDQNNQRDLRQTITKRCRCLSDGPNVTDLRAAVCEGQAWHAVEQWGPRADPPNQDRETGSTPLTRRLSAQLPLSTWNAHRLHRRWRQQQQQLAYFHLSLCLSPSKHLFPFMISCHDCLSSVSFSMMCAHVLLSFIRLPKFLTLLSCPFSSPLTSMPWLLN